MTTWNDFNLNLHLETYDVFTLRNLYDNNKPLKLEIK